MDLAQIIRSRRTVHNYKREKIADELVRTALELSLWAPNHKLTFPCRYYEIGESTRTKLADLSVELKSQKKSMSEAEKTATRDVVLNPSHLILLGLRRDADVQRMHEDYATLACGVQIASLYLWSSGVGTKWTTGGFSTHARTYEILGLSPSEVQLEGGLMIGVPAASPAAPPRPPLERILLMR